MLFNDIGNKNYFFYDIYNSQEPSYSENLSLFSDNENSEINKDIGLNDKKDSFQFNAFHNEIKKNNLSNLPTCFITKNDCLQKDNIVNFNKEASVKDETYKYFSFEETLKILKVKGSLNFIEKYKINKYIEDAEFKLCNRKTKRQNNENIPYNTQENKDEKKKSKRGRKQNGNSIRQEHTKTSGDNIIKKIKAKLMLFLVIFMNKLLGKKKEDIKKIYQLDYKYVDQLKKDIDLDLLKMSLKNILTKDITSKLKKLDKNFNKKFIQKIENEEEPIEDYETIMFVLNMTFGDWLSLITFKKSINEIIIEKGQEKNESKINIEKIRESLNEVNTQLNKIIENYDETDASLFIFYLYNYERYFFIKAGRNKKSYEQFKYKLSLFIINNIIITILILFISV